MNTPKLAIITSGGANFYSIEVALKRLGVSHQLTTDKEVVNNADGVIFPGVGSAGFAMKQLQQHDLIDTIRNYKKPLLGICLGMQLLYEHSSEDGVDCLGIMPGKVERFDDSPQLVVPQMGWNNIDKKTESPLLNDFDMKKDVYFVHSYYAPVNSVTVASCNYGVDFTAISHYKNFYGMQFHPEKSGVAGAQLIKNFIEVVNGNLSGN
jgi:glutamine amidotransferase